MIKKSSVINLPNGGFPPIKTCKDKDKKKNIKERLYFNEPEISINKILENVKQKMIVKPKNNDEIVIEEITSL
jgi:hypothetical protein